MPSYVYASRDDHIVPWRSAYRTTALLGGDCTFVLGASGHIAGVINPPQPIAPQLLGATTSSPTTPDDWLAARGKRPGQLVAALARSGWPATAARATPHRTTPAMRPTPRSRRRPGLRPRAGLTGWQWRRMARRSCRRRSAAAADFARCAKIAAVRPRPCTRARRQLSKESHHHDRHRHRRRVAHRPSASSAARSPRLPRPTSAPPSFARCSRNPASSPSRFPK